MPHHHHPPHRLPTTAGEFFDLLVPETGNWEIRLEKAEEGDPQPMRVRFWLAGDGGTKAYVTWEHGRLIVNLDGGAYHFDLGRLHEGTARWDWRRQVGEKSWASDEDMGLLEELYMLCPRGRA